MANIYIIGAARTPVGQKNGILSSFSASQLGAVAIRGALKRSTIACDIPSHVYMGHALQAGCGQCPAKQAAVFAGLPKTIEATTVNKVCASGLKAVCTAAQDIAQGYAAVVVAGGMESMSNVPRYQKKRLGKSKDVEIDCKRTVDGLEDGLLDPYTGLLMGACAEQVVTTYEISRNAQDDYALASYNRAIRALEYKKFCAEITILQGEMGPIDADEARAQATFLRLSELSPVFTSSGSITCGNACSMADGAAAVVLADEKTISKVKLAAGPFARIVSFADAAEEPQNFALAPSRAIKSALERANLLCQEITRWEINEAFAAVVLVNQKILDIDIERINIDGGAIVFGHPLGSSGCRILVSLLYQLQPGQYGVAVACNGGGGATAILIQCMNSL